MTKRSVIMVRQLGAMALAVLVWQANSNVLANDYVPPEVVLQERGYGWLLTDAKGMTLYTFSRDQEPGKSACDEECAEQWPPLLASTDAGDQGDWSTLKRDDGSLQWAFRGKPLYTYNRDVAPGDLNGDEIQRQWYVATKPITTPPGFATYKSQHGHLLVELNNMTLYVSDADQAGASSCDAICARTWRPVEAYWSAVPVVSDWSVMTRDDGTKQWAYKSKPLYRYAEDSRPGDIAGTGLEGRQAIVLEPPPPVPEWITYQKSDGGELLADPQGKTIYAHVFIPGRDSPFVPRAADGKDRPYDWTPVLAAPDAKPIGQWSIVTHEDGTRQWTHRGWLLYTNNRDNEVGALNGVRSTDRIWRPIMKSGQTMPGTGV